MGGIVVFISFYLFVLSAYAQDGAAQQQVVFISHPTNTNLTISDVKRFYSLRKKLMDNGERASLVMLSPDAPETVEAFRFLLGMYPYQVQRTWDRAVFSGKGAAPTVMQDSSNIIKYVAANPGAVGYVLVSSESELTSLQENVNVVAIVQ